MVRHYSPGHNNFSPHPTTKPNCRGAVTIRDWLYQVLSQCFRGWENYSLRISLQHFLPTLIPARRVPQAFESDPSASPKSPGLPGGGAQDPGGFRLYRHPCLGKGARCLAGQVKPRRLTRVDLKVEEQVLLSILWCLGSFSLRHFIAPVQRR